MDFDAISWEFMPCGRISTIFSGFLYPLFHACSWRTSLWIRLLESRPTPLSSASLQAVEFDHQAIEFGGFRIAGIDEIGIGDDGRASASDPAAGRLPPVCKAALPAAFQRAGRRQAQSPMRKQPGVGEHRRR